MKKTISLIKIMCNHFEKSAIFYNVYYVYKGENAGAVSECFSAAAEACKKLFSDDNVL